MTNNGKKIILVQVELVEGRMRVHFGGNNIALNSHAIRLASLQLDNSIMAKEQENEEKSIQVPRGLIT